MTRPPRVRAGEVNTAEQSNEPFRGWSAADASAVATNRKPEHFVVFVGMAAGVICHRRLTK
ncbi:hypothetical protein [Streptomyces sp. cg35]|uniref:hypothetical protein n=1 Tax=Streptomyces sp. cg35 TaxID=3421650 RepID=UPI003D17E418